MILDEIRNINKQTEKLPVGELLVRQAKKSDLTAIAKIEDFTSAAPWSEESLLKDIEEPERAIVLVAVDKTAVCENDFRDKDTGGMILGYADVWMVAGEAQLNNIAVLAKYRGNGVGEAVLTEMMKRASASCDSINLEVRISNKTAISLYEKLGFKHDGIRRGYYENNHEDAILMSAELMRRDVDVSFEIQ